MKGTIEFNLLDPEDRDHWHHINTELDYASKNALREISEQIFRPARKHGYSDQDLQTLLEKSKHGHELIAALEEIFHNIVNEYDIKLYE